MIESYQRILDLVRSNRYHFYNDGGLSCYVQLEYYLTNLSEALKTYDSVNAKLRDIDITPDGANFTTYTIAEALATMNELSLPNPIASILSGLENQTFSLIQYNEDVDEIFTIENLLSDIYGIIKLAYKSYLFSAEEIKYINLIDGDLIGTANQYIPYN